MAARWWSPIVLSLAAVVSATSAPARADVRPLTLYEKTGRAPLVVHGEVIDGEHRFAVIRVEEVLRCDIPEHPGETFRIAYKLDSFLRAPWQDKIIFLTGERVLLFLRKFTKEDGEKPEGDLYTLMWGAQGKTLLPPEGERAWVGAVQEFVRILAEKDLDEQGRQLWRAASSVNPVLSDGAFEEMLKEGVGDLSMIDELTSFFSASRAPTRLGAMRLLRQILADARIAGRPVPRREELADRLRGHAVSDASAEFRVETVRTMGELGGEDIHSFLQRLAKEDPSQLVRYEAERLLIHTGASPR